MPNQGYVFVNWTEDGVEVSTESTYSFEVTGPRTLVANFEEITNYWTPESGSFQFYVALTRVIQIDGVEQASDQLEVGAFCGDQCRGSQLAEYWYFPPAPELSRYVVYLCIFGNEGDSITFRLYDHSINQELYYTSPDPIVWSQSVSGYNEINPYPLNFISKVDINVTVNPEGAGTVEGTGEYSPGSVCVLSAIANPGYQFKDWTLDGTVVSTEATYAFEVTEAATFVANFECVHTQPLANGWNWWSTYVDLNGIQGLAMLENGLGNYGEQIQSRNDGFVNRLEYSGYVFWSGSLRSIDNSQMYMISTNQACNVAMGGNLAPYENLAVSLSNGWSWIGYPVSQTLNVSDALSQFSPEPNDQIKGRNGYSTYTIYGSYSFWSGSLRTLEPGQGYMYLSNSQEPKTVYYASGREVNSDDYVEPRDYIWTPVEEKFAHNMTVTAVVELGGKELRSEEYEIAVFVGDECRGRSRLTYVEPVNRYVAFLLVFGEEEANLRFVISDGSGMSWSEDHYAYSNDGILGSVVNPITLHFGPLGVENIEQNTTVVYPNPSNGVFNIEGMGIRKVEVVDSFGRIILSNEVEDDFLKINLGDRAAGVYLLRVVTDNGIVNKRVIKNN